jgi:hypothetical protein
MFTLADEDETRKDQVSRLAAQPPWQHYSNLCISDICFKLDIRHCSIWLIRSYGHDSLVQIKWISHYNFNPMGTNPELLTLTEAWMHTIRCAASFQHLKLELVEDLVVLEMLRLHWPFGLLLKFHITYSCLVRLV